MSVYQIRVLLLKKSMNDHHEQNTSSVLYIFPKQIMMNVSIIHINVIMSVTIYVEAITVLASMDSGFKDYCLVQVNSESIDFISIYVHV